MREVHKKVERAFAVKVARAWKPSLLAEKSTYARVRQRTRKSDMARRPQGLYLRRRIDDCGDGDCGDGVTRLTEGSMYGYVITDFLADLRNHR